MDSRPVEASVVIAVLNAAEHIEEQLTALARQQTDVSWELILADNGCTDDTLAIVDRVSSQFEVPVRVVDASARPGIAAARNIGVAAAAGELLLFCDADDVVDEFWVGEMVRALREHQFVGGRLELLELNGEEVYSWRYPSGETSLPESGGSPRVMGCNHGCTAADFAAVGGYSESLISCDDIDISLKMLARGLRASFAEDAVVHYRYRREPIQAVRQSWWYGKGSGAIFGLYSIAPPTFLDMFVVCYRAVKHSVRLSLAGRLPVRPAVDIASAVAAATVLWRNPGFWHPVFRNTLVANPVLVQRDRLERLAGLVRDRADTARDRADTARDRVE